MRNVVSLFSRSSIILVSLVTAVAEGRAGDCANQVVRAAIRASIVEPSSGRGSGGFGSELSSGGAVTWEANQSNRDERDWTVTMHYAAAGEADSAEEINIPVFVSDLTNCTIDLR